MDSVAYAQKLSSSPRCVGTPGEKRAAEFIAEELRQLQYNVVEENTCYVSWKWYRPLLVVLIGWIFTSIILLSAFIHPILSLTEVLLLALVGAKVLPSLELRMAKGRTKNIIASRNEEKDWRLILTAHYDSSWTRSPYIQRNLERILRLGHFVALMSLLYVLFLLSRSIAGSILNDLPVDQILFFEFAMTGLWLYPWLLFLITFFPFSILGSIIAVGMRTDTPSYGADDNASGVAVLLELASVLKSEAMNVRLDVAIFSAEEVGLFGSRQWVNKHEQEIDPARTFILNLDSVGRGEKFFIVRGLGILPKKYSDAFLCGVVEEEAEGLGLECEYAWLASSDHAEFLRKGFRACSVLRADSLKKSRPLRILEAVYRNPLKTKEEPFFTWIHSNDDTFDNLDPRKIRESADLVVKVVRRINEAIP